MFLTYHNFSGYILIMINMSEIINRLKFHEGCILKPYKCPRGFLTIGIGRNLVTNPLTAEEQKVCEGYQQGINLNQAYYLCKNDIIRCEKEIKKIFPFFVHLDDERKYAVLDMCFQLGCVGLSKFRKMLGALEIGDYRGAAKECLNSSYAKQVPSRAKRIAALLEKGKWIV